MPNFVDLLTQLQSPDVHTRSQTVLQLTPDKFNGDKAIELLVQVVCHDTDLNVVEDATWVLAQHGANAVPFLLAQLTHSERNVRHNIVHTLGKIGDKIADSDAVLALIHATHDSESSVRLKAVYALGQIGDPQAIDAIIMRLDDSVADVNWTAREVLEGFGKQALGQLITALATPSAQVRELVANLLGDLGESVAVQPLIVALNTEDWQVRFAIIEALGNIGDVSALPIVAQMTQDAHPPIRAIANRALKSLQAKIITPKNTKPIQLGNIYWVTLPSEHDQDTRIPHPHVVIQITIGDAPDSIIMCAITSNLQRVSMQGNVLLDENEGNLPKQSVIEVSKIVTLAKDQLGAYIGTLSHERVSQIWAGINFIQTAYWSKKTTE
jgi:mRNA interferase MazF